MPLPDRTELWPPKSIERAYTAYRVWDAWFAGDTDQLAVLYSATSLNSNTSLWGQVKRFFWGTPNPSAADQRPNKLHVPIASEIARMSAALLFGQMPTITFPEPESDEPTAPLDTTMKTTPKVKTAAQTSTERLAVLLDDNAHARLLEAGEYAAAHGGSFVRVSWDQTVVPDAPFLTTVPADTAVPEFRWGRLSAVTFWAVLASPDNESGVYTLLERHEPGSIEWGLYHSLTKGELGDRVPLTQHAATQHLAAVVNNASSIDTGSELLTAAYFPNMQPNRLWRKDAHAANLGRSDFDGAEPLMDALDEAYTSWMRDIRLGKARIIVPKGFITNLGAGNGAMFNADQEVFVETGEQIGSLNPTSTNGNVSSFMEMFQPNIRWAEHMNTVTHLLERIYSACGYSASTFGEAGDTSMTATESTNREKLSVLTRGAKILFTRPPLRGILGALMDVDQHVFSGPGRGALLPDIEFTDAAAENPKTLAETLQLLAVAEATSIRTRVQMLHEDWDDEQIDAEVLLIEQENSHQPLADPMMTPFDEEPTDGAAAPTGPAV